MVVLLPGPSDLTFVIVVHILTIPIVMGNIFVQCQAQNFWDEGQPIFAVVHKKNFATRLSVSVFGFFLYVRVCVCVCVCVHMCS